MKVYGTSHWFDKGQQCRGVVAAKSKKAAAAAFGMSMYMFNCYASETGNEEDIRLAMKQPGKVIKRETY